MQVHVSREGCGSVIEYSLLSHLVGGVDTRWYRVDTGYMNAMYRVDQCIENREDHRTNQSCGLYTI